MNAQPRSLIFPWLTHEQRSKIPTREGWGRVKPYGFVVIRADYSSAPMRRLAISRPGWPRGIAAPMASREPAMQKMRSADAAGGGLTNHRNHDRMELPARAEERIQTQGGCSYISERGWKEMRITFHLWSFSITIYVRRLKNNRHSGK